MEYKLIKKGKDTFILISGDEIVATNNQQSPSERRLSTKNCQAIVNGYDLDYLAKDEFENSGWTQGFEEHTKEDFIEIYVEACKTVLSILGDRKFSESDLIRAIGFGFDYEGLSEKEISEKYKIKLESYNSYSEDSQKFIQSLTQTEWNVEFETSCVMGCQNLVLNGKNSACCGDKKQSLDSDGCLILKIK